MTFRNPLILAALAAAPVFLAGCLLDPDKEYPIGFLEGQQYTVLKGAKSAVALDGKLYVANRDTAANGVAVVDLRTGNILSFHASVLPPNEVILADDSVLVVTESNYKVGALSRLNVKTGVWSPKYKSVGSDNALTSSGGTTFLMESGVGVVTGFNKGLLADANVVLNANTGANSNPHQIAVHGKSAFVTRYGSASLLVLEADKKDGGTRDSIDLSAYVADDQVGKPGAVPNMDAAVIHGDRLFVTVQRLSGWVSKDVSKVLIIDAKTRKVTGEIPLRRKNPFAVSSRGKWLFVSCVEDFGTFTGAVEKIDMEKGEHAGIVVEEKDLVPPSDLTQFVPVDDSKGFVLHTPDFKTGHISQVAIP